MPSHAYHTLLDGQNRARATAEFHAFISTSTLAHLGVVLAERHYYCVVPIACCRCHRIGTARSCWCRVLVNRTRPCLPLALDLPSRHGPSAPCSLCTCMHCVPVHHAPTLSTSAACLPSSVVWLLFGLPHFIVPSCHIAAVAFCLAYHSNCAVS